VAIGSCSIRFQWPAIVVATLALTGCFTGERPTLLVDQTIPRLADEAATAVITVLDTPPTAPFTVTYTVTTKYGGLVTEATVGYDPALGTSVNIAEVRYLSRSDGSTLTCSTISGDCTPGIDETRVSDRQLTSSIFSASAADRMRQDVKVAVADSVASTTDVAGRPATCATIPVVDSSGLRREKVYCAFANLGVIASLDTADLLIEADEVLDTADPTLFTGT
jgi:hypothetical protein